MKACKARKKWGHVRQVKKSSLVRHVKNEGTNKAKVRST